MIALKQTFVLLVFMGLACSSFVLTYIYNDSKIDFLKKNDPANRQKDESYFFDVEYFRIDQDTPFIYLQSKNLTFEREGDIFFILPEGDFFTKDAGKIHYKGMTGRYGKSINLLTLKEDVKLDFNTNKVNSNYISYDFENEKITAIGDVKTSSYSKKTRDSIKINSEKMVSWPKKDVIEYREKVDGKLKRMKAYEEGVDFSAEKIVLDLNTSLVKLFGNVKVKKGPINATSRSGEIFMENYNKRLKYFALYDDVKVNEKVTLGRRRFLRRAFSEKLEGVASEDKVILTGFPKVFQEKDIIKGNTIVLRENNDTIEVDDASTNFILRKN